MTLLERLRRRTRELKGHGWFDATHELAAAEIERLQAALGKHGRHNHNCAVYSGRGLPCDCGWADILQSLREEEAFRKAYPNRVTHWSEA